MNAPRKIKWLIAHHPQYLFVRTAKFFKQELDRLIPGQFDIEILSINEYIEKYNDIEEMKLKPPSIPGLEEKGVGKTYTRVEQFKDTAKKWEAIFEAIENGKIELSQTQVTTIGSTLDKDFTALDLPFLFKTHDHATEVLDGEIGEELLANLANKSGLRGLAFTYSGGYRVIGSNKELTSLEDLLNTPLLSTTLPSYELFNKYGSKSISRLASTPKDYADLAENDGAIETTYLRFTGKHVLKTEHSMFLTSILTGNKFWNSLTDEQRTAFKTAAKKCAVIERSWSVKDAEMYEKYADLNGVTINKISEEDLSKLESISQMVYEKVDEKFTPGLVSKIRNLAK